MRRNIDKTFMNYIVRTTDSFLRILVSGPFAFLQILKWSWKLRDKGQACRSSFSACFQSARWCKSSQFWRRAANSSRWAVRRRVHDRVGESVCEFLVWLAVQESLYLNRNSQLFNCFPLQVRLTFSSTGQTSTMSVRSVDGGGLNRMWIRLAATEDERVYGGEGVGVRLRRHMQF